MHTDEIRYLLPEYLQGKLDTLLRADVERHLTRCADCRREMEELRATLRELEHQKFSAPSASYFASLVPRIRMRLEGRTRVRWLSHPMFTRIALPLATAGLTVALLVRLPLRPAHVEPFEWGREFGIAAILDSDDLAEVLASQPFAPFSELETTIPEEVVNRQLAAQLITNGTSTGLNDWIDTPTDQLLTELSEEEVVVLLQRLEERVILQ